MVYVKEKNRQGDRGTETLKVGPIYRKKVIILKNKIARKSRSRCSVK